MRGLAAELREATLTIAALRAQLDESAVSRLTDSLLDGCALFDPAAIVLDVNPALCKMTGFAAEELVGTAPPHPCWPPEELDRFLAAMADVVTGNARPVELHLLRKDDARVPVLVTPSVLRADDGEVVSVTLLFRDLSERRRFEAALAESEELFRLTFDQAPVGAALFQGRHFRRVNDALCTLLGHTREELLGLGFLEVTHPEDRDVSAGTAHRLGSGDTDAISLEKRYLHKNGATIWARTVVRAVRDADGQVIAQLAMIDDITERRRILEELRESEQRLHTVLSAAHEGIVLQGRDGTILTFNKAAEVVFGVEEADVLGESALGRDWQTIHADGSPWPPEEHPTMLALRSGLPSLGHQFGVVRGGETRWLSANAYPIIPDGETEAVAAVVSFSDQTDRLASERALRESEERYRLLLHNANDAVYVHEVTEEGVGRFIEVNDHACEMLGYSREEFLAMDVGRIDTPEQHERTPAIVEELLRTGHSLFETEHVARDGRRIPVEISTRAFELQGRTVIFSVTRDISERVAAAVALRETRRLLDETQKLSRLGGWEYDVAAAHFTWTDELYRLHGVGLDFDVNDLRRNIGFYAPEDQAVIDAAFAGIIETGVPYDLELQFRPAGTDHPIWVRTTARAEMQDGRVVRVVGNLADIDERKQTALALAAERERAQTYLDIARVMIVAVGSDGIVTVANRRACQVLGRGEADVVGRDWFSLAIPDEVSAAVREVFDGLMRGEAEPWDSYENEVVTATGARRLIAWHNVLLHDADGSVAGTLSSGEDITERRRNEEMLQETEERYRSLFEQSPFPVWVEDFSAVREWFDAQGAVDDWGAYFDAHPEHAPHCAGLVRILASNQAGLDLFGVEATGSLTSALPRYFTEESYPAFRDELATLAGGGTRFAAEVPIADLEGARHVLDVRVNVVPGHEARLDRVLISFIDVTEQRAAEAEIRRLNEELQQRVASRTEQLDASTRELEALAYSIAHDVRAPLRTIDGFSAAVMEDEGAALSDDAISSLQRVRAAAQTLARLLDDLTGLSHASRRELVRRTVDLTTLAEEVGHEVALEHPARAVELVVAPELSAEADPMLARIILRELLGNAWKFTATRNVAHVEVGALDAEDGRAFFVRDDGVGFDMRYAEHLFGVFQRMHSPEEFEGDGVGLAMVQRLVRRHGGRCWAEAELEKGATFFFTLPGRAPDEDTAGPATQAAHD